MGRKKIYTDEEIKKKNVDSCREYFRTPKGRGYRLFSHARWRCRKKGIEFDLTKEWVMERINAGFCEVTGIPFEFETPTKDTHMPFTPSLDRIDPLKGYTKNNIQVVCRMYNQAKGTWTHEDVLRMVKSLA